MKKIDYNDICFTDAIPDQLGQIYCNATTNNYISFSERLALRDILLSSNLSEEAHLLLNRIFYAIRRKWVKVLGIEASSNVVSLYEYANS